MFGKVAASAGISKFQADVTKDKAITTPFVPAPSKLVAPASVESVGIFVGLDFQNSTLSKGYIGYKMSKIQVDNLEKLGP